jgi:hypothetical protein
MLLWIATLVLQDRIELRDFQGGYSVERPKGQDASRSWPAVVDLRSGLSYPGRVVIRPDRREPGIDGPFVRACLADAKTRHRIDPRRVTLASGGKEAPEGLVLASEAGLFSSVILVRPARLVPPKSAPPCLMVLAPAAGDPAGAIAAALVLRKRGTSVSIQPGDRADADAWIESAVRPPPVHEAMDEYVRQARYLDATLAAMDLVDSADTEAFGRARIRSFEGAGLVALGRVELAVSERRYKDAYLRCKEAAREFAWLPVGEKIRKRLGELEAKPEVRRAMGESD